MCDGQELLPVYTIKFSDGHNEITGHVNHILSINYSIDNVWDVAFLANTVHAPRPSQKFIMDYDRLICETAQCNWLYQCSRQHQDCVRQLHSGVKNVVVNLFTLPLCLASSSQRILFQCKSLTVTFWIVI